MLRGVTPRHSEYSQGYVEHLRAQAAAAGRKGASTRWGQPRNSARPDPITIDKRLQPPAADDVESHWQIKNAAGNSRRTIIDIYGEIGGFGLNVTDIISELRTLETDVIELHLNSPGGVVTEGVALFNALVQHEARVEIIVDSIAASVASVIAQAGDNVTAARNATLMVHDAWGGCLGNADDMRDMADMLDRFSDQIADVYAIRSGKGTTKTWRETMRAETWYTAAEAKRAGLIDDVIKLDKRGKNGVDYSNSWAKVLDRYSFAGRGEAPDPILIPDPSEQPASDPVDSSGVVGYATPVHSTGISRGDWDGGAAERRLPSPMTTATAKKVYAWYDGDRVDADGMIVKGACKLPHHEVTANGEPGAANMNAVRNALARLSQSDIPESEYAGIRRHLRSHLDDGAQDSTDQVSFDGLAATLLDSISRAASDGVDTEALNAGFETLANNAPEPTAQPKPEPEPEPDVEPEPEAVTDPDVERADAINEGLETIASDAPAPTPTPKPEPEPEPEIEPVEPEPEAEAEAVAVWDPDSILAGLAALANDVHEPTPTTKPEIELPPLPTPAPPAAPEPDRTAALTYNPEVVGAAVDMAANDAPSPTPLPPTPPPLPSPDEFLRKLADALHDATAKS